MAYLLLDFLTWLISLLPRRGVIWLSRPLAWLTWHASKTKRATTLRNLQVCFPEMGSGERDRLARESMRHYVLNILELGLAWHGSAARIDRLFEETVGMDLLETAQAQGRGVLLLVPHMGNWELMSHWVQKYFNLHSLYKPGPNEAVNARLLARRKRLGAGMVPATPAGLRHIYRRIREGHTVAVLPDQEPSAGEGRFAPFFGVPALTAVLAPRMIQKTGCLAAYVVGRRMPGGRLKTYILPADDELYSADMDTALAAMNRGVERCIELEPEQYLWAYKRFRRRPEGEARLYDR